MKRISFFRMLACCALCMVHYAFFSCADDDSFSTSTGLRLDFSVDTLKLDTVFSRTPSSTYSFWVHNRNNDGVRLQNVRLKRGNQSGYRVNVDGLYLDNANGSQVSDIEIRRKDSVLVFVELTASDTYHTEPIVIEDDLLFTLESGVEQKVLLQAWAWDAIKLYSPVISKDSVIDSRVPYIIYGDLLVQEGATLTIRNTSLFFHDSSGLEVYGSLNTENCLMRGDRLDRMFSYLPYDRVSGQWKGVHFYSSSFHNTLNNTEIRNSKQGILCDSISLDSDQYRLIMQQCIIHNCEGNGIKISHSNVYLKDCQITNTLGDCLSINGGNVELSYCTLAQFYPFSANRGAALRFTNSSPLKLDAEGLILTGYADDVLMGEQVSSTHAFDYAFRHSLLRTPSMADNTAHFNDIIWETPNDSIQGKDHFVTIDEDNLYYDFHLNAKSPAIGLGCYR